MFGIVGGGAQAEFVLTTEDQCVRVPPGLDLVEAGGVPEVFMTAHDAMVTLASLKTGERVLVHAVGSAVGTAVVQIAVALGCEVVGTRFPTGSVEFDCALVMRNLGHEWHSAEDLYV